MHERRLLLRAAEIGRRAGLRFVYAGNLPGMVGDWENTRCPQCNELLIERLSFRIRSYRLTADGTCPKCATRIPGRWDGGYQGQLASVPFIPRLSQRFPWIRGVSKVQFRWNFASDEEAGYLVDRMYPC
jgi:hypothetical protein